MSDETTTKPAIPLVADAGAAADSLIETAGKNAEKLKGDLAERIETARSRSVELAETASTRAREFAQDHPVATIAGGIVIGALIAGALGARSRRTPAASETLDTAAARLGKLATLGAEIALTYAARATEAGGEALREGASHLSATGSEAGERASELAEAAFSATREAGETLIRRLLDRMGRK